MSLDGLMVHNVTILRAGTTSDRYGNVVKDWSTAGRNEVRGWVAQHGTVQRPAAQENVNGREAQLSNWIVYLPAGTDVNGLDRIVWEGTTFEVDGPVNPAWSPITRGVHHIEANVRVVEG